MIAWAFFLTFVAGVYLGRVLESHRYRRELADLQASFAEMREESDRREAILWTLYRDVRRAEKAAALLVVN